MRFACGRAGAEAAVESTANPYRHTATGPANDLKAFVRAKVNE